MTTPRKLRIGVQLHPQATTMAALRTAWEAADALQVDSIFTWDHFYPLYGEPSAEHFEGWSILAAMAATTSHAQFGMMVTCNSYRNPELLADIARTVDHISGGRLILGIGAGWFERDYTEYGYEFGTAPERLKALGAALPRIKERLAKLNPAPLGDLPILIGGSGPKVTTRLVAQYAQIWNGFGTPQEAKANSDIIDTHCANLGRNPDEIERSVLVAPGTDPLAYFALGLTHVIYMVGSPFDLDPLAKAVAIRDEFNT